MVRGRRTRKGGGTLDSRRLEGQQGRHGRRRWASGGWHGVEAMALDGRMELVTINIKNKKKTV